jgi:hypothetical protein
VRIDENRLDPRPAKHGRGSRTGESASDDDDVRPPYL